MLRERYGQLPTTADVSATMGLPSDFRFLVVRTIKWK